MEPPALSSFAASKGLMFFGVTARVPSRPAAASASVASSTTPTAVSLAGGFAKLASPKVSKPASIDTKIMSVESRKIASGDFSRIGVAWLVVPSRAPLSR
ncbi:hypothetical protein D9M68_728770 [compost metagenome]